MKGKVMSSHEKMETRRCPHQDTESFITPSLHSCFFQDFYFMYHLDITMLFFVFSAFITNIMEQNKDVEMGAGRPKGCVAALLTTSAGGDFSDSGS